MKWKCRICGYVYDEEAGLPEQGIGPGTKFENLPSDWACPVCGAPKAEFEEVN
jgi:rubredoxin